jgi:hypothetical protein
MKRAATAFLAVPALFLVSTLASAKSAIVRIEITGAKLAARCRSASRTS